MQAEQLRKDLVAAHYSARYFREVTVSGNVATISFDSGDPLTFDLERTRLVDCRMAPLPDAGPVEDASVADGNASLQWVAYDYHYLYCSLSNGHVLLIPDAPERSLHSIRFLQADNPGLSEDFTLTGAGKAWTGKLPPGSAGFLLKPSILFRGKSLLLDGKALGEETVDFGKDVQCRIDLAGGGSVSYTLSIEEDFPTVRIYTEGAAPVVSKTDYVTARIVIDDPEGRYSDVKHFEGNGKIRGRGNSTWNMPKKPYRIKLDKKASLFGIPAEKDWVLLANYSDKTLMRHTVAMRLSEICGLSWTPKTFPVEVYLNDEYQGCYDLTEHKEVSDFRVRISPSGYYLEIEAQKDQPVCFDTGMKIPVMFNEPETPDERQQAYVKDFFAGFESALLSEDRGNPETGYPAWIDVDSFINQYIIQELTKNIDADLFKSLFLTLEEGGKLCFAHVWDFDLALGNCDYFSGHPGMDSSYKGWYIRYYTQEGRNTGWYWYLFQDPAFRTAVKTRWAELYPQLEAVSDFISARSSVLSRSAHHNFTRWDILGTYVWPNVKVLGDYMAEVEYMRDFYRDRLHWMNAEIEFW